MPPKRTASQWNVASMPPQIRMHTRNGPRTPVQGSSVGVQDGPTTSRRIPEILVPQPPRM
ncbi:hypothetical protein HAX54_000768, partial [Datura stramonium]|nr:hypothetical protein [Datura stramonium]